MKLLTPRIIQALPPLQSTQHIPLRSKIIICKFYVPGGWAWYVFEGEVDAQKIYKFFGMIVRQNETFMGYFYLADLIELIEEGDNIQLNVGWPSLTYYRDTTELYERFKDDIWTHITEESEASGYTNPFAYLAEFQHADSICDAVTMENWLVRYMAESIAYRLTENKQKFF